MSAIVDYPRGAIVGPGRVVRYERPRFVPTMFANCVLWLNAARGVSTVDAAVASPNDLSAASWQKVNSTTPTADTLQDTLGGGPTYHYCQQSVAGLSANHEATLTLEIAAGTKTRLQANLSGAQGAIFDTVTGTVVWTSGTATIVAIGGGWFRCTLTAVPSTSLVQLLLVSGGSANYQGNGTGTIRIRAVEVTQHNVSLWRDESGAGNDFAQATAADRVGYYPNQYNGQPALRSGDQTDHLEHATSVSLGTAATIVLAHKQGSTANNYVTCDAAGANGIISRFSGGLLEWFNGSGADRYTLANTPAGLNVYTIRQTNGVALQAWRNGVSVFGPVVPAAALTDIKSLFGRSNATNGSSGEDFTEAVVYQRAVSDAERVRVERMVGMHWGVAVL